LAVLCCVLFLDGIDVSMVTVALPSIKADLHLSTSQLQWVVSGYVLGYGGLLLLGGRTADLLGRRRAFREVKAKYDPDQAIISAHPVRPAGYRHDHHRISDPRRQ
jgi:hypothetical protein